MSEHALWDELHAVAQGYIDAAVKPEFRDAYRLVARTLAICHRLGVEHPGVDLLGRDSFTPDELDGFFFKTWRLATLHAEQRRTNVIEVRRGVAREAEDMRALRTALADARQMILDFGWLGETAKRRCLDQLEALQSDLQRARDDFDVALAGVDDPARAATIEIGRPSGWADLVRRVVGVLGPTQVAGRNNGAPRTLPAPKPDDA
jgi:hypothetical protein